VTYRYATAHVIQTIIDARGNTAASATYFPDGRLQSETDAVGNTTRYAYDLDAHTMTVTNPDGGVVMRVNDAYGKVTQEIDPLGRTTTSTYDTNHNLTARTNALGQTTTYAYDAQGNQTAITNGALDATRTTTYNRYGGPVTMADMLGQVQTIGYDAHFAPASITDALGTRASFTFDSHGSMLTETNGHQETTTTAYDAYGNQLSVTDPLQRQTTFTYDQLGRMRSRSDALGNATRYTYDALGHTVAVMDADGFVTSTAYDGNGNKISATDARGQQTTYTYDAANRLIATQFPDGTRSSATYDFRGQKLTETNPRGIVTRWSYDVAGQLTSVMTAADTPVAATISYTYTPLGEQLTLTDARGHTTTTTITYLPSTHQKQVTVADPLNQVTTTTFNAIGQRIRQVDARQHLTTYTYDARGMGTQTTYPDGSTTQQLPDAAGRILSRTDQAHKTTQYAYDAAGQLTSVTNPDNETTSYRYERGGNVIGVTDANSHTTTFGYDRRGMRTTQTLPLGMTETTAYDGVGNIGSVTDFNGATTSYVYDALNRLSTITPDPRLAQPTIRFTFTPSGQRATMMDASGTTTYDYDAQDRLTSKATPQGTLSYTYDANGNVLTLRSSNANGVAVDYTYDALNRLATVTDTRLAAGLTTYQYDPAGNLTQSTLPNGVQTVASYNDLDRLINLATSQGNSPLANFAYTLDAAGARTQIAELNGRTTAYTYDDARRLLSETISGTTPNGSITYTYDHTGNRLTRTSNVLGVPSLPASSYDANDRITGIRYDANGNTLEAEGVTYDYDYANRLISTSTGVHIAYNGDGVRVAETVAGTTTHYVVDEINPTGYAQVVEELVGGMVQRRYTYGSDLISQTQVGTGETQFYGYDGLGSVRFLMDASGATTDTYTYDAFGTLVTSSGTTLNSYRFTGEQQDAALGLYYLRARYYNAGEGRFWSRDIAEIDQNNPRELNRYTYVANDPVNAVDPSGYLLAETGGQNQQSEEAAAGAEPVGAEVSTSVARSAATFERQFAQENFNTFFGRSIRPPMRNPVTVGQGDFVDINGIQRQFMGTNNFYGSWGQRFQAMANDMRAANPGTDFLGGTWSRTANQQTAGHFEELVVDYLKRNISQIPDKGRVAVGVANKICNLRCQPLLIDQLGGQIIGDNTIIVTLERGIKIVFVAAGL